MKGSNGVSAENEYCDDISWIIHDNSNSNHMERTNGKSISTTNNLDVATITGTNNFTIQDTIE